jgi:hypothetical protein
MKLKRQSLSLAFALRSIIAQITVGWLFMVRVTSGLH